MADTPLRALVADDEEPALAELVYLLSQDHRIGEIQTASNGPDALKLLQATDLDVVFCDIKMPGLDGIDLARVLSKFASRPQIVFVTAYDEHAVAAFDLEATDYVMKPVRPERLAEAVRRVVTQGAPTALQSPDETEDEVIPVELAGVTRFVQRSTVRYVEAQGDYARLHTGQNSHLVRIPLSTLEERWRDVGFTRIHRSTLVALQHVDEMRVDGGRCAVRVGDDWLPVSRRHTRELRDLLVRSTSLR
ncbi:LytTR family DNA-binding domain-containing protein [Kribbella solani]|uniref:LytR/AlgR family response regulator transcription factor n=1 Tax=Kribbella solani TaxID=236067 RepID=UPI0029A3454A|nr:LytTR family DNA-binding domain-containing protein [Kribbella solani]MDX2969150.1 LytTR family DNA-binding domain-containing protein [Kribbella solani]MDX3006055.1 LytTR family DNA-binding domain-containing protein [Kribbella solani]